MSVPKPICSALLGFHSLQELSFAGDKLKGAYSAFFSEPSYQPQKPPLNLTPQTASPGLWKSQCLFLTGFPQKGLQATSESTMERCSFPNVVLWLKSCLSNTISLEDGLNMAHDKDATQFQKHVTLQSNLYFRPEPRH